MTLLLQNCNGSRYSGVMGQTIRLHLAVTVEVEYAEPGPDEFACTAACVHGDLADDEFSSWEGHRPDVQRALAHLDKSSLAAEVARGMARLEYPNGDVLWPSAHTRVEGVETDSWRVLDVTPVATERLCACGCGEPVTSPRPEAKYATGACRVRALRRRSDAPVTHEAKEGRSS